MVQVDSDHYSAKYQSPERFQLYYHLFRTVMDLSPSAALEVGIGSAVVTNLLRQNGVEVTTADFDPALRPDVVADVRNLPFEDDAFDVVIASQVLEHIPFTDLKLAMGELSRTARNYCVISIPFNRHNFTLYCELRINRYLRFRGGLNRLLDRYGKFYLNLGISRSRKSFVADGEHQWEIGYKEYPLIRVRETFAAFGQVVREFRVPLSPYHYVFVLRTSGGCLQDRKES